MTLKELIAILQEAEAVDDIEQYREEILDLIPKARIMVGFNQRNHAHQYDLWTHSLNVVVGMPKDIDDDMLYLAALLHDIGKPDKKTEEVKEGKLVFHFYGHPERSMEITRDDIIPGMLNKGNHLSEDDIRRLLYYVCYHDDHVSLRMKHLRRHLKMGASLEEFQKLMMLQVADAKAHIMIPIIEERIEICEKLAGEYSEELYRQILAGK